MRNLAFFLVALGLAACSRPTDDQAAPPPAESPAADPPAVDAGPAGPSPAEERLAAILDEQPLEVRDRYQYRHPQETLQFFGIEPGMTVVEALPGGGWYSKILIPYLGPEGRLIGADYARDMYSNFDFATPEFLQDKLTWVNDWSALAQAWYGDEGAKVGAFVFGSLPEEMHGTADAVLLIRALHNLARFEADGSYLTQALEDCFAVLKPGGIAGIVQHEARDIMPDEWAGGQNGYLKRQFVIDRMQAAGFEFVEASDINANELDQPTPDDNVWRLPPSLRGSLNDDAKRAAMEAIGESNRMTLKFRKPAM